MCGKAIKMIDGVNLQGKAILINMIKFQFLKYSHGKLCLYAGFTNWKDGTLGFHQHESSKCNKQVACYAVFIDKRC